MTFPNSERFAGVDPEQLVEGTITAVRTQRKDARRVSVEIDGVPTPHLITDYLVIGAGAAGMAFTDSLLSETEDVDLMVDRREPARRPLE